MNRAERVNPMEKKDNLINLDDKKLVELSQQGDQRAFAVLYNKYRPEIVNVAQIKAGRGISDFGETVAQDVFLKAWENIGTFRGEKTKFRTWLWNILKNHLIDVHRKRSHRDKVGSYDKLKENEGEGVSSFDLITAEKTKATPDQERVTIARRNLEKIEEILENEDPIYREMYQLSFLEDLKDREIAEKLDISIGTVKSRIRYLREKIKHLKEAA